MSTTPKTYEALSSSELDVLAAVSVTGTQSTRPQGVGILSATPGLSDLTSGISVAPVQSEGPTNIVAAIE